MEKHEKDELIRCCVKNCNKAISKEEAIKIGENYFCGICGVAYYRSNLNL